MLQPPCFANLLLFDRSESSRDRRTDKNHHEIGSHYKKYIVPALGEGFERHFEIGILMEVPNLGRE